MSGNGQAELSGAGEAERGTSVACLRRGSGVSMREGIEHFRCFSLHNYGVFTSSAALVRSP